MQTTWNTYTASAEAGGTPCRFKGAGCSTKNDGGIPQPDTQGHCRNDGSVYWDRHDDLSNRHSHIGWGTHTDVSPPPRIPHSFASGTSSIGVRPLFGDATRVYEECDDDDDDEGADGYEEDEWVHGENEEGKYAFEEDGKDDDDDVAREGAMCVKATRQTWTHTHESRALQFDGEGSIDPHTPDPRSYGQFVLGTGQQDLANVHGHRNTDASGTPGGPARFRRTTPVVRAAYSMGYDCAAGESSEDPPKTSQPLEESAAETRITSTGISMKRNEKDAMKGMSQSDYRTPTSSPSSARRAGTATPAVFVGTREKTTAFATTSVAGDSVATHRDGGGHSALALPVNTCGPGNTQERVRNGLNIRSHGAFDCQNTSIASSPLSPHRPTLEARVLMDSNTCSDVDSSKDFKKTAMSPVFELGEDHEIQIRDFAGVSAPRASTVVANAPESGSASPPTTVNRENVVSGMPNLLLASGRSRSVENLLSEWEFSTPAADIVKSACEREMHVRSISNSAASPNSATSPPPATSLPMQQCLSDVLCCDTGTGIDENGGDLTTTKHGVGQAILPVPPAHPSRQPPLQLNVCIKNVFSYSESEKRWLFCDELGTTPGAAAQRVTDVSSRTARRTTPRAGGEAPPTPSVASFKVSLYCRPLLVQLPNPSLHTSLLCAAGDRALVRITLAIMYYVSCVMVPRMIWGLLYLTLVMSAMTAGLAATDAAWGRWPNLKVYAENLREQAAAFMFATRDMLFSFGEFEEGATLGVYG